VSSSALSIEVKHCAPFRERDQPKVAAWMDNQSLAGLQGCVKGRISVFGNIGLSALLMKQGHRSQNIGVDEPL
jgi:hypothetical protein